MFNKLKESLKPFIPKPLLHVYRIIRHLLLHKTGIYEHFIKPGIIRKNIIAAIENRYGSNLLSNISSQDLKNFKAKLKEYKRKYSSLIFEFYQMRRIGEMCLNFHVFMSEDAGKSGKHYIIFPITFSADCSDIPNTVLYNKIKQFMDIIDDSSAAFWLWVIKTRCRKIHYSDTFSRENILKRNMIYTQAVNPPSFSEQEEHQANHSMKQMGLHSEFVCIYNRDNAFYRSQNLFDGITPVLLARNSSIKSLYFSAEKLFEKNIQCVRMGSIIEEKCDCANIIDYPNLCRSELMDLYLIAHCKFFAVTGSGIMLLATLFGKPIVFYNIGCISFGGDMVTPMTPERDIMLMKKIYLKREKRFLTLREILKMEETFRNYNLFYEYINMGCEFIDNTPEEIWDVINEMNQRLDHTISYSQEEKSLQERYINIVHDTTNKNGMLFYDGAYSTKFLVNNPWFLE